LSLSVHRAAARLEDPGAELLDRATGAWDRYGRIVLIAMAGLPGTVTAAGTTASKVDATAGSDGHRFYRVRLLP